MSAWLPGRCKACQRPVYWHKDFGWCEKPAKVPQVHRCPKGQVAA